jgi:hypothetical protein
MSNKTDEEIISFIKSLSDEEDEQRRIEAFIKSSSHDVSVIAYMLANRILLLKRPLGIVWAPPRWLPRLKRMARRLGAKTEVEGSKWIFSLPGMEIKNEDFKCFGRPSNNADLIMPFFVFRRRSDIEREAGYSLAGTLIVDIPLRKIKKITANKPPPGLSDLAQNLVDMSKDGRMPADGVTFGWPHPAPPYGDEIQDDHELMKAWTKDKPVFFVRWGDQDPCDMRLDSDMLLCMGLGRDGKPYQ